MGRRSEFYAQVGDGKNAQSVGYSSTSRDGFLGVRFVTPDGKRVEKMTNCKRLDPSYHLEAARILARAFSPVLPTARVSWDDAMREVEKTCPDLRPATLKSYRKCIKAIKESFATDLTKQPTGPGDITPELAARFGRLFLSGTFKRGKGADAKTYKRKPVTLSFYIRGLSALWGQFRELGYVKENPWTEVRRPQIEKKRRHVPTEDDVEKFFTWVRERYPEWERLHALLSLKALSGCRTLDIVQLKTAQLRNGRVTWAADQTKNKEGRAVLVPDALFTELKRLAGKSYLWEGFVADLRRFRSSKNRPSESFEPSTVYYVVNNLFREYADAHPDRPRLSPHAFRRRAITLTVMATGNVDATAQAIGVNPQTARGYYLDAQRAFNADDVFRRVSSVLIPEIRPH